MRSMPNVTSRRSLRAPFVITTAVALAACGGRTAEDGGSENDGGTHGDGASQGDAQSDGACSGGCNPPPTNQCPQDPPLGGLACSAAGLACSYSDDCTDIGVATYRCSGGAWVRDRNGGTVYACPATAPDQGASCFACRGDYPHECDYGDCDGRPTTQATCDRTTLQWQILRSSCNPPPPNGG